MRALIIFTEPLYAHSHGLAIYFGNLENLDKWRFHLKETQVPWCTFECMYGLMEIKL